MSDADLMANLNAVESEIGTPGFWDRPRDEIRTAIRRHVSTLKEAVSRGLTTWSREDEYGR